MTDSTMRAFRLVDWERPPEVAEAAVPVAGSGQLVVRVAANGLCHSDFTMQQIPGEIGTMLGWSTPFTLGHEIAGWVDTVGDGVDSFDVGDAVALVSPTSCGSCSWCERGQDSACPAGMVGRGYGRDGGLAPFVLATSVRDVVAIGPLDPVVAAPLTDAGATSYHAVKRVLPYLGDGTTAIVIGAGGLGSFAIQFLRALSDARVIAVDANRSRLAIAEEIGAHDCVEGVDAATAGALLAATSGEGADAVLDFVGIDTTIDTAVQVTRRAGVFGLVGAGGGKLNRQWFGGLPNDAEIFTFQGSNISDLHDVIALAAAGRIRSDVDVFEFSEVEEAYRRLEAGELRGRAVVLPPS